MQEAKNPFDFSVVDPYKQITLMGGFKPDFDFQQRLPLETEQLVEEVRSRFEAIQFNLDSFKRSEFSTAYLWPGKIYMGAQEIMGLILDFRNFSGTHVGVKTVLRKYIEELKQYISKATYLNLKSIIGNDGYSKYALYGNTTSDDIGMRLGALAEFSLALSNLQSDSKNHREDAVTRSWELFAQLDLLIAVLWKSSQEIDERIDLLAKENGANLERYYMSRLSEVARTNFK